MSEKPQVSQYISRYPDPRCLGKDGWLRPSIVSWCETYLTDFCQKMTSRPEAPLAIYFVSQTEALWFERYFAIVPKPAI